MSLKRKCAYEKKKLLQAKNCSKHDSSDSDSSGLNISTTASLSIISTTTTSNVINVTSSLN